MRLHRDRLAKFPFLARLGIFLLLLALLWLPFAAPIYLFVKDANTVSILTMSLLFVEFIVLLRYWGLWVYQQSHPLRRYGLVKTRQNGLELLQGLSIGFFSLICLFIVQGMFGWLTWQVPSFRLLQFVLEGLLVALGVGLAEELVFRGWLWDELQRDYGPSRSLWISSLAFAVLHFIKPLAEVWRSLPQFWGLLLLGLALAWAKRSSRGRLGLSIGLHAGLVWGFYIINVGQLVIYTQRVPEWLTGINQNPLAGVMGLVFLSGIAAYLWWRSRQTPP